ncbi:nuclear transport factor 2 family protein [Amycolatopsis panacis]|uniref:Nuclear transport factor 2 family protein n=1 Tax=Amycolatopsis panacis TaxID=2340917 RepID=A0A419I2K4_9PSEU|nr:nuclear transport factor 2 family protein [Amycolatopsis panacis]RJQ84192.1 nuclear transport factor 2 family protein [Amycolatopsis panacis]
MIEHFEARLARLEAIEDIKALKMHYAKLCDAGYPAQEIGKLFVDSATWDGGEILGVAVGRQQIEEYFAATPANVPFALHYIVGGDIVVASDGRSATGTWYLWQPMILRGAAVVLMGTYDDEYVLTGQGWRYANLRLTVHALTPATSDWVTERFIQS